METLPTAEEAFGARPVPPSAAPSALKLPTADEAFGQPGAITYVTPGQFERINNAQQARSVTNIFNAFGYSAKEAFGPEPVAGPYSGALSPETQDYLHKIGIFNDWSAGQRDVFKGLVENTFKHVAAGLALGGRGVSAVFGGAAGATGQALEEAGLVERGREQLEGLPADPGVAMLFPLGEPLVAMANARRAANLRIELSTARANGVLAEGEAGYYAAKELTPENAQARVMAAEQAGVPPPIPEPAAPDIHVLARRIEPEVFERYDALEAEKGVQRETIRSLAAQREALPEAIQAQGEIDTILGKVRGVEDRLTGKARERLADAHARLTAILSQDTPEMATARRQLMAADIAQRDMIERVASAYRQADEMMQSPVPEVAKAMEKLSGGKTVAEAASKEPALAEGAPGAARAAVKPEEAIEREQQRKTVGPRRAPGTVRFYHGGVDVPTSGGGRWASSDAQYAADYREGATLYYVDVPVGHPMEVEARAWDDVLDADTNAVGTYRNIELPEDLAKQMRPVAAETVAAERVTPPKAPSGALKGIPGTGPLKTRTLSEGIEAKAIENELAETFAELPAYNELSMADQAAKAMALLAEDEAGAKAIAMGLKPAPRGLTPEAVLVAVERAATASGDVETLRQLATESRLTTAATTMGQRIRVLGERDKLSAVDSIREVQAARIADLERRNAGAIRDTVREMKASVTRAAATRDTWATFIETITCAE